MKNLPTNKQMIMRLLKTLDSHDDIKCRQNNNTITIEYIDEDIIIYQKCLTSAFFKTRPDVTRAQLPKLAFPESINSNKSVFMFWGYDASNDVYAVWDPEHVKQRLNKRNYVSFYSRQNLQDNVKLGEIKSYELTNNVKYVLFKREDSYNFIKNHKLFFTSGIINNMNSNENKHIDMTSKLMKVEDDPQLSQILTEKINKLPNISNLTLMQFAIDEFGNKYPSMSYLDWHNIIVPFANRSHQGNSNINDENETQNHIIDNVINREEKSQVVSNNDNEKADNIFHLQLISGYTKATCDFDGHRYKILSGSYLGKTKSSFFSKFRRHTLLKGNTESAQDGYILIRDLYFKSSSAAASFCLGYPANGMILWKDKNGRILKDILKTSNNGK